MRREKKMIQFPKPDVEQFLRSYVIRNFDVSKDESLIVFSSNLNGKFNLWAMDAEHLYPYALTYHDQANMFIKIDPEKRFILADMDQDGDENYKIYALPIEGGVPLPLFEAERKDKFFFGHLSKDGERLYYLTSKNNPNYLNIHCYNLKTKEDRLLHEGSTGPTEFGAVSPEEKSFFYLEMYANTYAVGFVKIGERSQCITPSKDVVHTVRDGFYYDENRIYFITNYESEYAYLASYDIDQDRFTPVLKIEQEDIKAIGWHKESQTIYLVTEKGVTDLLYAYSLETQQLSLLEKPVDVVESIKVMESGSLYLLGRSATKPLNIYQKRVNGEWRSLTKNVVLGVAEEEMVEPEVVRYTSFDGMEIEALLFKAKPDVANGYTVFWPHGGPQAAERKFFRPFFQLLAGRGYSVFAPNFRGSTGYGASFEKLVEGDWGEGPRLDCVAGIEWLFEQGIVDRDKLFLVGGSYGGYMSLLLSGRHPEYFRAVVDIFGVSNLFTFYDSVPDHWKPAMKRWLGDPVEDRERFIKDSPITYLDQMVKPLLVIQGANDPRVVKAESDQIVAKLRENGVEVEYLVFDDEGHGFSRKVNEIKAYRTLLEFLERHQ